MNEIVTGDVSRYFGTLLIRNDSIGAIFKIVHFFPETVLILSEFPAAFFLLLRQGICIPNELLQGSLNLA